MNLIKTSILSTIETSIKLASGFVIIKYIATKIGPEGVAYFGQFQNFITSFIILIAGGFTTGLVCYSAQEKMNNTRCHYMGNALGLGLLASFGIGLFTFLFAPQLSLVTFKSAAYANVFYLLAISGFFIMIYQVLIAVFNGLGELFKLIVCKSASSLLLLSASLVFIHYYGLIGGLVALVIMQAISAFIGLWLITQVDGFEWQWLKPRFNFKIYKEFSPYWTMSGVTLISTPLVLMLIRTYVAANFGWSTAGIWEASWKISELYLLVITTSLTTYYVPKLSQAKSRDEELIAIKEVFIFGVSFASFLAAIIYIFRHWFVSLLFSNDFSAAANILPCQLIGSVIKIAAWVFAYHMLIMRRTKLFLISELLFGLSFYIISKLCLQQFGLIGLSYAYAINYSFYFMFCLFYLIITYSHKSTHTKNPIKLETENLNQSAVSEG